MSLKVVYDTSVVVSAALKAYGTASTLLSLALTRQVTLYMSQPIFQEYQEVLERPKFRLPIDTIAPLLGAIRRTAVMVTPKHRVSVSPDEPDNRFLECAPVVHADYLVTNNTRHFAVEFDCGGTFLVSSSISKIPFMTIAGFYYAIIVY
jgi:putative PIN family toxin of toxin-antitoxin system